MAPALAGRFAQDGKFGTVGSGVGRLRRGGRRIVLCAALQGALTVRPSAVWSVALGSGTGAQLFGQRKTRCCLRRLPAGCPGRASPARYPLRAHPPTSSPAELSHMCKFRTCPLPRFLCSAAHSTHGGVVAPMSLLLPHHGNSRSHGNALTRHRALRLESALPCTCVLLDFLCRMRSHGEARSHP